jgi:hypothetical protein
MPFMESFENEGIHELPLSNFIQTLVCKVFNVFQYGGSRGETRGTMPDALNKATCYRKLAEEVAKRAECVANGAIRRH